MRGDVIGRDGADAALRDSAAALEQRVAERTAVLEREIQLRAKREHQLLLASEREQRRSGQEALGNDVAHAYAKQVVIRLEQDGSTLRLEVRDDGCRLPAAALQPTGRGQSCMRYRAESIGATFTIRSARNIETEIACGWTPTDQELLGGNNVQQTR